MAYDRYTWVDGETITAQKLNHIEEGIAEGGDAGYECVEETKILFNGTVNLQWTGNFGTAAVQPSAIPTSESVTVVLDGETVELPRVSEGSYGDFSNTPIPVTYPVNLSFYNDGNCRIFANVQGEHTILIQAPMEKVVTTPCFEKAVEKVATPLIPTNEIVVVDVSGTNMSATDYENALGAWRKGNPVLATQGASTPPTVMVGASSSLGGTSLYFEEIEAHLSQDTLYAVEITVNTPNNNYEISKTIERYSLTKDTSN